MPGPDPNALWIEETEAGGWLISFEAYGWSGNTGNRRVRALAILKRLRAGTWACLWCGDDFQDQRRADAVYCCEGCRKRQARARRKARHTTGFAA